MPASEFRELFDAVAAIGRSERGWTRPPWSAPLREAEQVVADAAARAGLVAAHDAAGNLWLTDPAAGDGLVAAGSHLDTVPGRRRVRRRARRRRGAGRGDAAARGRRARAASGSPWSRSPTRRAGGSGRRSSARGC